MGARLADEAGAARRHHDPADGGDDGENRKHAPQSEFPPQAAAIDDRVGVEGHGVTSGGRRSRSGARLEHDPEKWEPVFGKDHAQTKSWSPTLIPSKRIRL
jgi:hypothetical protein